MPVAGVFARERITINAGAIGTLDLTLPNSGNIKRRANCALIQVLDNAITYTTDGTDPTASVGFEIAVGSFIELPDPAAIKNFKAFGDGAGATQLEVAHGDTWMSG